MPSNPDAMGAPLATPQAESISPTLIILVLAVFVALIFAAVFLIRGYTWEKIRNERSFDLLMVCGTIVLPMLSPFPVKFLENWLNVTIPTTAPEVQTMSGDIRSIFIIVGFLALMFVISAIVGLLWNKEKWWQTALVFWVPFTIFYTTIFTKGAGFFTGTIGSLGYWLAQQGVARGSQPWYFYLLIQIPIYEFLAALGLILAIILGLRRKPAPKIEIEGEDEVIGLLEVEDTEEKNFPNTFSLLVWWSITSIIAFSYAGEKMPWLTYHMAWPMILITGWALGRIIDTTNWAKLKEQHILLTISALGNIYRRRHGNDPCPWRIHSPISRKRTGAVTSHQHLPPAIGRNHPKRNSCHHISFGNGHFKRSGTYSSWYSLEYWLCSQLALLSAPLISLTIRQLNILSTRMAQQASKKSWHRQRKSQNAPQAAWMLPLPMMPAHLIQASPGLLSGICVITPTKLHLTSPPVHYAIQSLSLLTRKILTRSILRLELAFIELITSACGGPCRITLVCPMIVMQASLSRRIMPAKELLAS